MKLLVVYKHATTTNELDRLTAEYSSDIYELVDFTTSCSLIAIREKLPPCTTVFVGSPQHFYVIEKIDL